MPSGKRGCGVLITAIPNGLINLCMADAMHCHLVMQPFATILGVALIIVAIVDTILLRSSVR